MFHDKNGFMTKSGKEFLDGDCEHLRAPEDRRGLPCASRTRASARSRSIRSTTTAPCEVGVHRFFQLLPGKPEKLVEVSQFTHVWKKDESGWKLARVISFDHQA